MTRAELAALIKSKNPAYKDIPDEELVSAVIKKYPIYANQLDTAPSAGDMLSHRGMALESPIDETGKPAESDSPFLSKLKGMVAGAAAPPTSLTDLAKKIALYALPSSGAVGSYAGTGGDFVPDVAGRTLSALKGAAQEVHGIPSGIKFPLRAIQKFNGELPSNSSPTMLLNEVPKRSYGLQPLEESSSGSGSGGAPLGTRPPSSGGAPSSAPIPSDISSITGRPNAIPGVDAGDIVRQGYRGAAASHATDLDRLLNKFGGKGPEFKSGWPPEGGQGDWHSGAEPGSTDAAMAHTLHPETRALDDAYSQKINDPLAALLMSLGIGAGAAGARR